MASRTSLGDTAGHTIALAVIDRIMGGATENHPGRYGGAPAARGHAEAPRARTPDHDGAALDGQALR